MFIVVNHTIYEPNTFMNIVQQNTVLPEGLTLHGYYPAPNFERATCLWEAQDISEVQDFLDRAFGSIVKNDYMVVNEEAAIGLPAHIF